MTTETGIEEMFPPATSTRTADEIVVALEQEVPAGAIMPADRSKAIFGDYIVGQLAIHGANRIFGTWGWHVGVTGSDMVIADDGWVFTTTVNVVVKDANGITTSRPGVGVGIAFFPVNHKTGEVAEKPSARQIDTAVKGALTDAIKNALSKFGRVLGGQLYFDEREAQVLGWEIESERRSGGGYTTPEPPVTDGNASGGGDRLSELGSTVIKYGVGKGKKKKFRGMTIAEVYAQDPGYCQWVASLDNPKGFVNERIAEYMKLLGETIEQELEKPAEDNAEESASPIKYPNRRIGDVWLADLLQTIGEATGEGKTFGHAKHVTNHLKKYFGVSDVHELTRLQAYALKKYIKTGERISPPYPPAADDGAQKKAGLARITELMATEGVEERLPLKDGETPLGWLQRRCTEAGAPIFFEMSDAQLEKVLQVANLISAGNVDFNDPGNPIVPVIEAAFKGLVA